MDNEISNARKTFPNTLSSLIETYLKFMNVMYYILFEFMVQICC